MLRHRSLALASFVVLTGCGSAGIDQAGEQAAEVIAAPSTLDVDINETSVSGISSGGYMAVQFHVAFSSIMRGVAVFAAGPYACARGQAWTAITTCMSSSAKPDVPSLLDLTASYADHGAIDPITNLRDQRVFLFGGADDTTVNPAIMDGLRDYYAGLVDDPSGAISFDRRHAGTAHTMPTTSYGGDCATTGSPYLGKCGFDGAGTALAHIMGPLAPAATTLSGSFVALPQAKFIDAPATHSLADTAFAYVPATCTAGEKCRVHVAFHGCKQSVSDVGDSFYKHAGYNEWADTNHVIVLYPQTIASLVNPNACWDWWGYDSADYAKKTGPQMKMVKAILDHLSERSVP